MKKLNYLAIISLFITLIIDSSLPQTANILRNFNNKDGRIESNEILHKGYISYNSNNLDSFIVAKMNQYHVPGLAASIVKNGDIIWTGSYGFANIEDSSKVTDSTLFMIASISKIVTGVALMQLWEEGLFDLDDDINDYLPFQVHNTWFPDSAITFRMLLTHTSSIKDNWDEMPYWAGESPIPLGQYLEDYLALGGAYYHPYLNYSNFRPGTNWDYSNIAVALIGYLVEVIANDFSIYCQDSLFTRLDMNETAWFLSELDSTHIARPYTYSGGAFHVHAHYGYSDYPDGQLRTNTLQLSRFLLAFMQGGEIDGIRILDSTTVSLMTTIQYPLFEPTQGLILYKMLLDGRLIWGHAGEDLGVGTAMFFSPSEGTGIIFFGNAFTPGFTNTIIDALFDYDIPVSVDDNLTLPISYRLFQNYPNPFNPSTNIKYSVPKLSDIIIKVFDVLGNELETLVDEEKQAGTYKIIWNAESLPSGVYFYKLQANNFTNTKKMLLLR